MHTSALLTGLGAFVLPTLVASLPTAQNWGGNWGNGNGGNGNGNNQPTSGNSGNIGTVTVINQCNFDVGMKVSSGENGGDYDNQVLNANGGTYAPAFYGAHFGDPMSIISNGQSLKFWPNDQGDNPSQSPDKATHQGNELQMEYTIFGDDGLNPKQGPLTKVNYDISIIDGRLEEIPFKLVSPGGLGTVYTTPTNGVPITMAVSQSQQFYLCGQ